MDVFQRWWRLSLLKVPAWLRAFLRPWMGWPEVPHDLHTPVQASKMYGFPTIAKPHSIPRPRETISPFR